MMESFKGTVANCFISILPLVITFIIFQIFFIKMQFRRFINILTGILIAFIGIAFMIFGLENGYVPMGRALGLAFSGLSYNWLLIPISFIMGFFMTRVEPSVKVLTNDVDRETGGSINKKLFTYILATGVGISLSLTILKIILNISLWYFLIPGYIICLILSLFSGERFTALAFDAGGVTTGVMTTTFLLSMALGLSEGLPGSNPATDGFGLIAIVSMTPIILVMLLGYVYERKKKGEKKDV